MGFFRKQKNKRISEQLTEGTIERITFSILSVQMKWAKWLERQTKSLNRRQWILALGLFVLLTGGYSSYLISTSILSERPEVFSITSIQKPQSIVEVPELISKKLVVVEKEYRSNDRFRWDMDSLKKSAVGQEKYHHIVLQRLGIGDSLDFIENNYQPLNH